MLRGAGYNKEEVGALEVRQLLTGSIGPKTFNQLWDRAAPKANSAEEATETPPGESGPGDTLDN